MSTPLSKKLRGRTKGVESRMPGKNRDDVARYRDLYWGLYQAQLALDAQAACPQGHSFSDGFIQEGGRVVEIMVNVHIEPDGKVICRLCRNKRAMHYRQQIAEGKIRAVMTQREVITR